MRRVVIGQRSETVRRANLSAIVRELHLHGPATRSDLADHTGLTRSAIRGLIAELAVAGVVSEAPPVPLGRAGRPSPLVRLNPPRATVLALEIAVDSLAAAVVGLGGHVFAVRRIDRDRAHPAVETTVGDIARLARRLLVETPAADALTHVSVAVAAPVRRGDGWVALGPNLGWRDVPLGTLVARAIGAPVPVTVANEADLGALGEIRRGAAVGHRDVLFLHGEVGVGGGVIVGGVPLDGAAGYGGEVGHLPVDRDGAQCGCGSVGCWETVIGERALLARAGHDPDGGRDAVEAVLHEAAAGSDRVLRALDELGGWLGYGLAGLVNVLDPGIVVLGGLLGRVHRYVGPIVDAELDRLALGPSRQQVRVVPAALGSESALVGAAEQGLEPFLADPGAWLGRRSGIELASAG